MAAIEDYALIGDCRSAALVSREGAIDWLCWPRFDSASLHGSLLDEREGGTWRVAPVGPFRSRRRYLPDTNVLETRFETGGGVVRLVDLMPVASEEDKARLLLPEHELLRVAYCESGEVELEVRWVPRPDYGRARFRLRDAGTLGVRLELGPRLLSLRSSAPLRVLEREAVGRVRLRAGQRLCQSLTFSHDAPAVLPTLGARADEAVERSVRWWRQWVERLRYQGPYREAVARSALVLKLLCYAPSGAIIAAPTTSLPERPGGDLNWDYRYTWVRDASFTVRALFELGYEDEARAFISWMLHATRLTRPRMKVLYDVFGQQPHAEQELSHWSGYQGARPVRISNAAMHQLQLDAYGEVIDSVVQLVRRGGGLDHETRRMLRDLGEFICHHWEQPDEGIWEPREPPRRHTHSHVLCWVALQRLLEMHERGELPRIPADKFRENRELLRRTVQERGWSPRLGSYTQTLDGDSLDAALLLLGWYGFEPDSSERMRGTYRRVRERLGVGDGLLYRYEQSRRDGEGAFGICGFWAVEHLARGGGSLEEARELFERVLAHANDVGLFAEEMDAESGAPLGNFPQAFTHVGLLGAALSLESRARQEQGLEPRHGPRRVPEPSREVHP